MWNNTYLIQHMELSFSYNQLSEHTLRALGEVLGHREDMHVWSPSSGQQDKIAASFSSCRQLHMVEFSSWPGVSMRLYKKHTSQRKGNSAKSWEENRYVNLWGRMARQKDRWKAWRQRQKKRSLKHREEVNIHHGEKRPHPEVEPSLQSPACRNSGQKEAGDTWWNSTCPLPVTSLCRLKTVWHLFKSTEDSLDILANSSLQWK